MHISDISCIFNFCGFCNYGNFSPLQTAKMSKASSADTGYYCGVLPFFDKKPEFQELGRVLQQNYCLTPGFFSPGRPQRKGRDGRDVSKDAKGKGDEAPGITVVVPRAVDELTRLSMGKDEQFSKGVNIIRAHILTKYVSKSSDFGSHIRNKLGNAIEVKERGKTVTLTDGSATAKIKPVDGWQCRSNVALWQVESGDMPLGSVPWDSAIHKDVSGGTGVSHVTGGGSIHKEAAQLIRDSILGVRSDRSSGRKELICRADAYWCYILKQLESSDRPLLQAILPLCGPCSLANIVTLYTLIPAGVITNAIRGGGDGACAEIQRIYDACDWKGADRLAVFDGVVDDARRAVSDEVSAVKMAQLALTKHAEIQSKLPSATQALLKRNQYAFISSAHFLIAWQFGVYVGLREIDANSTDAMFKQIAQILDCQTSDADDCEPFLPFKASLFRSVLPLPPEAIFELGLWIRSTCFGMVLLSKNDAQSLASRSEDEIVSNISPGAMGSSIFNFHQWWYEVEASNFGR